MNVGTWHPGDLGAAGPSYSGSTLHPNLRSEMPWERGPADARSPGSHVRRSVVSAHQGRLRYERPRFRAPDERRNVASWRPGSRGTAGPSYSGSTLHPNLRSEVPWECGPADARSPGSHVLYRPRFVRHRIESYAASAARESWFWRTAAGV